MEKVRRSVRSVAYRHILERHTGDKVLIDGKFDEAIAGTEAALLNMLRHAVIRFHPDDEFKFCGVAKSVVGNYKGSDKNTATYNFVGFMDR